MGNRGARNNPIAFLLITFGFSRQSG